MFAVKKNRILLLAVNILLLLAFCACLIAAGHIRGLLLSQQAAKAFAGQSGERFAQVSAFLPEGSGFDESRVSGLRSGLDEALVAASLEAPEGGRLYADAWSGQGEISIQGAKGSSQAVAIGVGGDFFLFHPLCLRSGSYLAADDLMKDRVLLDEEMAWKLFGSVDLAGLEVTIGGKPFQIAGVVARENDFASCEAYTDGAGVFLPYESLRTLTETEISCYELVLADPISGFAAKTLQDNLQVNGAAFVENSARYSVEALFGLMQGFGKRSMQTDGICYPYWENAARYTEDWMALLLLLEILLLICPVVCGIIFLVKLIRSLSRKGRAAAEKRIEAREEREAEAYELEHPEEFVTPDVEDIVREVLEEQKREEAARQEEAAWK